MIIIVFLWNRLLALAMARIDLLQGLLALAGTPALLVGNAMGTRYFGRMPVALWRWIILGLIGFSALGLLVRLVG